MMMISSSACNSDSICLNTMRDTISSSEIDCTDLEKRNPLSNHFSDFFLFFLSPLSLALPLQVAPDNPVRLGKVSNTENGMP